MNRTPFGRSTLAALALAVLGLTAGMAAVVPAAHAEPAPPVPPASSVAEQHGWSPFFAGAEGVGGIEDPSSTVFRDPGDRPGNVGGTRLLRRQLKANVAYQQAVFMAEFGSFLAEIEGEDLTLGFVRDQLRPRKAMRPFIDVTPVTDGDFTLTMLADQACLSQESENALIDVVRGACDGDPVASSRRPLTDLVRLLEAGRPGRRFPLAVAVFFQHVSAPGMIAAADRSIAVVRSSVTDRDRDGLEDDGRYQVRRAGTSYCLQLPVTREQRTRLVRKRCAVLPARDLTWVSDVIYSDIDADTVVESIQNVSRNSGKRISRLGARELDAVRATLGEGLSLSRSAPLRFRVTEDESGCFVTIVFKADRIAAKARTTMPRCDA